MTALNIQSVDNIINRSEDFEKENDFESALTVLADASVNKKNKQYSVEYDKI